jgi:hypothetical protein
LKFRVGYGITGQEIGNKMPATIQPRKWKFSVLLLCYFFAPVQTKFESKVEETTTYNAGLDFGCTTIE